MSSKSYVNDEQIENIVIIPPDGGWGWVVVAVAFLNNFLIDGIGYTYGLYIQVISEEFDIGVGDTAMIGALMTAVTYFCGPFVSALLNKYDTRCVSLSGSIIASSAYIICSLSDQQYVLLAAYGIMLGCGFGMMYVPAIVMPSLYFAKYRALASGIGITGSGLGTLVIPPIVSPLLKKIGWRHTFQSIIIVVMSAGVLSLAYIPLRPHIVTQVLSTEDLRYSYSRRSISTVKSDIRKKKSCWQRCCSYCDFNTNKSYPTTSEIISTNNARLNKGLITASNKRASSYFGLDPDDDIFRSRKSLGFVGLSQSKYLRTITYISNWDLFKYNCLVCIYSECCEQEGKPMYRDDIFFNTSIQLLPKYKRTAIRMKKKIQDKKSKQMRSRLDKLMDESIRKEEEGERLKNYHMSVTRVTGLKEYTERKLCDQSIMRALATLLHLELFKSITFVIGGFAGLFYILGYNIPFMYVVDRAQRAGVSDDLTFWFLAVVGGANTVGRLMSGILPCVFSIDVLILSWVPALICGANTLCSGLSMKPWFQFLSAAIFGFFGAFLPTLRPIVIVELFGLENLTNIFGLQLFMSGIAAFFGPTLAGFLYDSTEVYDYSFYLSGSCLILSGVMITCLRKIRKWETKNDIEADTNYIAGPST